ncbi:membrane protein [Gordonia phage Trine]|uniref:Membrane protein n=1 Tax=Gordonia phage Trine TaxID=2201431 RepID=A0A2Z4QA95_9CAUD|nr:membrane protein [Gordonia phage Trine]AWY06523.1 membrane protein [Gordonia phage Trine]
MTKVIPESQATWGDRVAQYSKAIAATLTSAAGLGATLSQSLPAEQAAGITAVVAAVTGFVTWLVANTEILRQAADAAEDLGDAFDPER